MGRLSNMQVFYNVVAVICLISLGIIAVTMIGILIYIFVDMISDIVEIHRKGKKKKSKPSPRNALVFTKDGYLIYCKESNIDFNAYEEVERYKEIF